MPSVWVCHNAKSDPKVVLPAGSKTGWSKCEVDVLLAFRAVMEARSGLESGVANPHFYRTKLTWTGGANGPAVSYENVLP